VPSCWLGCLSFALAPIRLLVDYTVVEAVGELAGTRRPRNAKSSRRIMAGRQRQVAGLGRVISQGSFPKPAGSHYARESYDEVACTSADRLEGRGILPLSGGPSSPPSYDIPPPPPQACPFGKTMAAGTPRYCAPTLRRHVLLPPHD